MGDNFFLDGKYTQQQINSLNKIKSKPDSGAENSKTVEGDNTSIFNDINARKANPKAETNNSGLFDYIDKMAGLNDFFSLMDADGDGKISEAEAGKLAGLNGDNKLTSEDVDTFIKQAKNVKDAKISTTKGAINTEYTYQADSTGKLVKKSAISKDTATNTETCEYTYDANGNIKTRADKLNNRTTEYTYTTNAAGKQINSSAIVKNTKTGEVTAEIKYDKDGKMVSQDNKITNCTTSYEYDNNGKLAKSKVTITGTNTVKSESTYNDKGQVKDTKEYYSGTGGTKGTNFFTYEYDEYGRKIKTTQYKGDSATGEPVAEFKYEYSKDKYSTRPITRTNTKTNEVKEYTYNEDNELTDVTFKDKDGKVLYTCKCNKDGTYASMTKGNLTTLFEYAKGGIRTKSTTYNTSDLDETGKPKAGVEPEETTTYEDGVKTKTETKDGDVTEFDAEGNKTKTTKKNGDTTFYDGGKVKAEIQGDKAYVYTYNSDGTKVKATYNKSDIDDKGNVKPGAKPISTGSADESDKTDGTNGNNDSSSSTSDPASTSSKPTDKDWSVYIGKDTLSDKDVSRLQGKSNVVIDAQNPISKETISKLRASGTKVYSYLNIGSVEKYRSYYKKFEDYTKDTYENWEDEKWMDVSNKKWRDFVVNNLAEKIISKGCDGLWLDNLDVYEEYPSDKAYQGLVNILEGLNEKGVKIYVNGGNKFVSRLIKDGKANLVDGVMQEEVFTEIKDYDHDKFKKRKSQEYLDYLERCKKAGIEVSVLEYTKDKEYAEQIKKECVARGYQYNISSNVNLS